jgi:hypothetical protein
MEQQIAWTQLDRLAAELEKEEESFSDEERDAALELLAKVADSKDIVGTRTFSIAAENLLDAFAAAHLKHYVDDVERTIRPIAIKSRGITYTLVTHYGIRVVGDAEPTPQDDSAFVRYAQASERHKIPEIAMPFRMLYVYQRKAPLYQETLTHLWQDVRGFKPRDQTIFYGEFERLESWQKHSRAEAARIGDLAADFRVKHADEFTRIWNVIEEDPDLLNLFKKMRLRTLGETG